VFENTLPTIVNVINLAAVARVRQQEKVVLDQFSGGLFDYAQQRSRSGSFREQRLGNEALTPGNRFHVTGVVFAGDKFSFPACIMDRVNSIQSDMERNSFWLGSS